jgi:pimeloyl-ACP methyl ester carboxylesterase
MTAGLHVTRWGKGEPIVCVHGSFGWGEETFHAQRELADAYELLLIDRRAYGDSQRPSRSRAADRAARGLVQAAPQL